MLSCIKPSTMPGTPPAYTTFADGSGWPSSVTVTGRRGVGAFWLSELIVPVTPSGLVCPSPVRYRTAYPPFVVGLFGPLRLKSALNAPGPLPCWFCVKMPGTVVVTGRLIPLEDWFWYFTTIEALWNGASSYGTMAETCVALAFAMGAANPLISTCTPPSVVASLPVESNWALVIGVAGPMLVPKIVMISPGAIAVLLPLAALITFVIVGSGGVMVKVTLMVAVPVAPPLPEMVTVPV